MNGTHTYIRVMIELQPSAQDHVDFFRGVYGILHCVHISIHTQAVMINWPYSLAELIMELPLIKNVFFQSKLFIHFYIKLATDDLESSYFYCRCYWCRFQNEYHSNEWTASNCQKGPSVRVLPYSFPLIYFCWVFVICTYIPSSL